MSWYPHAVKRPMPYNDQLPKRQNAPVVVLHTNGGGTDKGSLYGWFSRSGNEVASHFQVMTDGTVEQYVDTDRVAYAQHAGNAYAVSIETQDDGHPSTPWSVAQVNAILGILRWLKVPAKLASDNAGGGVGWHSQFPDWNTNHHDCPGSVRVEQIKSRIIPALGDDVTADELKAAIREVLNEELVTVPGEAGEPAGTKRSVLTSLRVIWALGERLQPKKK